MATDTKTEHQKLIEKLTKAPKGSREEQEILRRIEEITNAQLPERR